MRGSQEVSKLAAFSLRLKHLRKLKRLQSQELARILSVDQSAISKAEAGKNWLSIENLIILHDTLGVNITWLLTGDGFPMVLDPLKDKLDIQKLHDLLKQALDEIYENAKDRLDIPEDGAIFGTGIKKRKKAGVLILKGDPEC